MNVYVKYGLYGLGGLAALAVFVISIFAAVTLASIANRLNDTGGVVSGAPATNAPGTAAPSATGSAPTGGTATAAGAVTSASGGMSGLSESNLVQLLRATLPMRATVDKAVLNDGGRETSITRTAESTNALGESLADLARALRPPPPPATGSGRTTPTPPTVPPSSSATPAPATPPPSAATPPATPPAVAPPASTVTPPASAPMPSISTPQAPQREPALAAVQPPQQTRTVWVTANPPVQPQPFPPVETASERRDRYARGYYGGYGGALFSHPLAGTETFRVTQSGIPVRTRRTFYGTNKLMPNRVPSASGTRFSSRPPNWRPNAHGHTTLRPNN